MYTPRRPKRAALLCCHFIRNLSYYRAGWENGVPIFLQTELWATINSNFIDLSVLEWCKLFADNKAFHSYKKVVNNPGDFLSQMYTDYGFTHQEWCVYVQEMKEYRDKFLAHLDNRDIMNIPIMDLAKYSILYLYDTMQCEQLDGVFMGLPDNLSEYSDDCYQEGYALYRNFN